MQSTTSYTSHTLDKRFINTINSSACKTHEGLFPRNIIHDPRIVLDGMLVFEETGIINKNAPMGAKHSKLKGLLISIRIAGSDNPLVEVEYRGKQSTVILTTQGESTLEIFGE